MAYGYGRPSCFQKVDLILILRLDLVETKMAARRGWSRLNTDEFAKKIGHYGQSIRN